MEPNLRVRVLASIGLYGPCVFLKGYSVIFLSVFGAVVIIAPLLDQGGNAYHIPYYIPAYLLSPCRRV